MARSLEDHCGEMVDQKRELMASEARINRACSTMGVDEARETCAEEFRRQDDIRQSAHESLLEQVQKG